MRKYLPLGKGFYLFGESLIFFSEAKSEPLNSSGSPIQNNYTATGLNFYPGISYAVNRKIHLEIAMNSLVSIGYSSQKTTVSGNGSAETIKSFNMNVNANPLNQPTIGFKFLLAK